MEENRQNMRNKKTIAAIVAVAAVAIVIFVCIFSLYHLPERDPVETPELPANATIAETPMQDFSETDDIMSASQQEVSEMLGELEMQYENAKVNDEPYVAEQAGMRLALAYWKAGETQQAKDFLNTLLQNYGYDEAFASKCREMLKTFDSPQQ